MTQAGGAFQVVFRGLAANITDSQKAGLIVKLTASFHMTSGDALRFLQLRNFVLHKHLEQHEAAAMAARFMAIGLDVVAMAMAPQGATAPLPGRGTGPLVDIPSQPAAAAARPQPAPAPAQPQRPPAAAAPAQAPAPAKASVASNGIVVCPECSTKVRIKDPANVRCAMCSTRIPVLNAS